MTLDPTAIRHALRDAGFRHTRKLGQHFLLDRTLLSSIADAGDVGAGDCVLEIGTGAGTLTRVLAERASEVVTVELDARLDAVARAVIGDASAAVRHIRGDVLDGDTGLHPEVLAALADAGARGLNVKCVSNFPYNIATPLVIRLLRAARTEEAFPLACFAGTVQLEAAQRWGAEVGASNYGAPAAQIQALAAVRTARRIAKKSFWPPPKVESAVVVVTPLPGEPPSAANWARYEALCRGLFSYRRKTVKRALCHATGAKSEAASRTLAAANIPEDRRVHRLDPGAIRAIADAIHAAS